MTTPKDKIKFTSPSHTKSRAHNALLDIKKNVDAALDSGTRDFRVPVGLAVEVIEGLRDAGWAVDVPDIDPAAGARLLVACESDLPDWYNYVKDASARRIAAKAAAEAVKSDSAVATEETSS